MDTRARNRQLAQPASLTPHASDLDRAPALRTVPGLLELVLALEHAREPRVVLRRLRRPLAADLARLPLHVDVELDDLVAGLAIEVERLRVLDTDLDPAVVGDEFRDLFDQPLVRRRHLRPCLLVDAKLER